jgi:hypothetical protein
VEDEKLFQGLSMKKLENIYSGTCLLRTLLYPSKSPKITGVLSSEGDFNEKFPLYFMDFFWTMLPPTELFLSWP